MFMYWCNEELKILNFEVQGRSAIAEALGDYNPDTDPHLERIKNQRDAVTGGDEDSDEEDKDFVAEKDNEGSPTGDSGKEASGTDNERSVQEKPVKNVESTSKPPTASKKKREDDEESGKKRKRKEDPNAPKQVMSGFIYYSQAERKNLKKTSPGINFTEMSKLLSDKWKSMSKEEREPYEAKSRADKARYS